LKRYFQSIYFAVVVGFVFLCGHCHAEESAASFSFGVVADCQYCAKPEAAGKRKYAMSADKLAKCVKHLNTLNLAYTIHLGDFIDRDFSSFDVVVPIYDRLTMPHYHVLGNHDFSVEDAEKAEVPGKLGLKSRYYDFESHGWRFIVLDGNDVSFHAHAKDSELYRAAESYYIENKITSPKWNGAVGTKQLAWLESVLKKADQDGESAVLYCHFPVYPADIHILWNADEIIALIEKHPCVRAYLNGHNHAGNYGQKNGVHYLTLKGMVDTVESSYAAVDVFDDRLEVNGYGREEYRTIILKEKAPVPNQP
jgi:manganese-dependent ADP-ribose/CDP-alcohol diphosphatase